jgi:hypothetical protein
MGAPIVNMYSYAVSLKFKECPSMTDINVAVNPSRGPSNIPVIGLIIKFHPYHTPAEKLGVTTESSIVDSAVKIAIKAILRVLTVVANNSGTF